MTDTTPKAMHEALCAAQSALGERARSGVDVQRVPRWVASLGVLAAEIERVRPTGPNGKHGDLHTPSCGCEGHNGPWSITLWPDLHRQAS
jgi:hypothetical protein